MCKLCLTTLLLGAIAPAASADLWPHADGSMKHLMVSLDGRTLSVHVEGDPLERMEMVRYPDEEYTSPADVLNDTYYSSRYGWMADGFIDLPSGAGVFVRTLSSAPGLEVYEGGMRSMIHMHSFDPILGTAGSRDAWMWGGTMSHNWYSAMSLGDYGAEYEVYVGDGATGEPLDGYTTDQVTVYFRAVPAPGVLTTLAVAALAAPRRRRGDR